MKVKGDGVLVDFRRTPFQGTRRAREIPEVVNSEGQVRGKRLSHRLAIFPTLGNCQHREIGLEHVSDRVQHAGAISKGALTPGRTGAVRGVKRQLDVLFARLRHFAERLAVYRRHVGHVDTFDGSNPLSTYEVVVASLQRDETSLVSGSCEHRQVV